MFHPNNQKTTSINYSCKKLYLFIARDNLKLTFISAAVRNVFWIKFFYTHILIHRTSIM